MQKFDITIVGNGILSISLARYLSNYNNKIKIAIIGPNDRKYSASIASGAMIAAYGELEEDSLSYKPYMEKFRLVINALDMWDKYHLELQNESNTQIQFAKGTYVINSSRGTSFEDNLFSYIKKTPKLIRDKNCKILDIPPEKIPGIQTRPLDRPTSSIFVRDGLINSSQLINALDIINKQNNNITYINDYVKKIDIKKKSVYLKNHIHIHSNDIILANGSFAQSIIDPIKELTNNIPRLFFGAGAGLDMQYPLKVRNEFKDKIDETKNLFGQNVIRTVDRGGACGVHFVPFSNNKFYLGASSAVFSQIESGVRASSLGFLLTDAINQISPSIGHSSIQKVKFGFRPVSEDCFPLLGQTHIKGIWYLNGMKRDGLTCSPYICDELAKKILKIGSSKLPNIFKPQRNLISYFKKNQAIKKTIVAKFNRENSHGMVFSDIKAIENFMKFNQTEIEKLYDKYKLKKFGIHPELLDLYKHNLINKKILKDH